MDLEGGQGGRPHQAPVVVILLGHHRQQAGDAHAVAAHREDGLVAVLGHERGAGHHARVLGAQLERVGGLDGPDQVDLADRSAGRRRRCTTSA